MSTMEDDVTHGPKRALPPPPELDEAASEVLAARICAAAASTAAAECEFLLLLGEFDAAGAVVWWNGISSIAHWLSWACSMAAGTAREHVRVARALRRMPTVTAAFAEGRLSFSKVRELTRVVDLVDEAVLCELARTATASQLARTVASFRTAAGKRLQQERTRTVSWTERESGTVDLRIRLPKEEATVMISALTTAKDRHRPAPVAKDCAADDTASPKQDATPGFTLADAVVEVARAFLDTAPKDRSGDDGTLVVVHVTADQLASLDDAGADDAGLDDGDVPAGTSVDREPGTASAEPTCHVQGLGSIEPETARRLSCDARLLGAVIDKGAVLALGRTRRLVSRAQRRALMIRDRSCCQYPGCDRTSLLKAHHRIHWSRGGRTDLDNLILLCGFHHKAVHEGQLRIEPAATPSIGQRWDFLLPDGSTIPPWWDAEALTSMLATRSWAVQRGPVDSWSHPDAIRIRPRWTGEKFDLAATVGTLFGSLLPDTGDQSERAAA